VAEHPSADVARRTLQAFMKGDMEAMAATIAQDAVWHIPGTHRWAGDFAGKHAIMERFKRMAEAGVRTGLDEIHDVLGSEEHAVALVMLSASGPGGTTTQRSVLVFHVREGALVEFWGYNRDQAQVDAVFGGS
jgi:ketosteroid isomerase-like protein